MALGGDVVLWRLDVTAPGKLKELKLPRDNELNEFKVLSATEFAVWLR